MILFNLVLCEVFLYNPSTLVEMMPAMPIPTTSQFSQKHRCCLSSQVFEGLL
jgi:hypothetical protein